jgi:hypothetical protein
MVCQSPHPAIAPIQGTLCMRADQESKMLYCVANDNSAKQTRKSDPKTEEVSRHPRKELICCLGLVIPGNARGQAAILFLPCVFRLVLASRNREIKVGGGAPFQPYVIRSGHQGTVQTGTRTACSKLCHRRSFFYFCFCTRQLLGCKQNETRNPRRPCAMLNM